MREFGNTQKEWFIVRFLKNLFFRIPGDGEYAAFGNHYDRIEMRKRKTIFHKNRIKK